MRGLVRGCLGGGGGGGMYICAAYVASTHRVVHTHT